MAEAQPADQGDPGLLGSGGRDDGYWLTATICAPQQEPGCSEFARGYRDFGGNEAWLSIFIAMGTGHYMNPICSSGESSGLIHPWRYGDSYHYSAMQFAPSSWATATSHTGLTNAENLYHVGAATAWWSNNTVPSEQWSCWP